MEQVESIPFSNLIAGMLLLKKSCTSVEIADKLSKLEGMGIMVDDENDDIRKLSCCVEISSDCSCFHLKKGLEYDTVLYPNVTVFEFLNIHTNEKMLSFLNGDMSVFFLVKEELPIITSEQIKEEFSFFGSKKEFLFQKKRVKSFPFLRKTNKVNCRAIV